MKWNELYETGSVWVQVCVVRFSHVTVFKSISSWICLALVKSVRPSVRSSVCVVCVTFNVPLCCRNSCGTLRDHFFLLSRHVSLKLLLYIRRSTLNWKQNLIIFIEKRHVIKARGDHCRLSLSRSVSSVVIGLFFAFVSRSQFLLFSRFGFI